MSKRNCFEKMQTWHFPPIFSQTWRIFHEHFPLDYVYTFSRISKFCNWCVSKHQHNFWISLLYLFHISANDRSHPRICAHNSPIVWDGWKIGSETSSNVSVKCLANSEHEVGTYWSEETTNKLFSSFLCSEYFPQKWRIVLSNHRHLGCLTELCHDPWEENQVSLMSANTQAEITSSFLKKMGKTWMALCSLLKHTMTWFVSLRMKAKWKIYYLLDVAITGPKKRTLRTRPSLRYNCIQLFGIRRQICILVVKKGKWILPSGDHRWSTREQWSCRCECPNSGIPKQVFWKFPDLPKHASPELGFVWAWGLDVNGYCWSQCNCTLNTFLPGKATNLVLVKGDVFAPGDCLRQRPWNPLMRSTILIFIFLGSVVPLPTTWLDVGVGSVLGSTEIQSCQNASQGCEKNACLVWVRMGLLWAQTRWPLLNLLMQHVSHENFVRVCPLCFHLDWNVSVKKKTNTNVHW